jgi:ubiquitin C-terminal hydrolase
MILLLIDIQLNVKGCKNLEDSFKDYIIEETLEGDNKYMAEGYGLQDAKKGVIFESFPPVLHLQLKRFEYDMMRDMMVKVNKLNELLLLFANMVHLFIRSMIDMNSLQISILSLILVKMQINPRVINMYFTASLFIVVI